MLAKVEPIGSESLDATRARTSARDINEPASQRSNLPIASRWLGFLANGPGFIRDVLTLTLGTAAAQSFTVLAAPVLTRICSPAAIGQLALFTSFMSVAAVAVSLKYELGIVSAPNALDAARLTYAAAILSGPVSVIGGIVFYGAIRYSWMGFGGLPTYAPFLMVAVLLLTGVFTAFRYWAIRHNQFGLISRTTVGQHSVRALAQVGLGMASGAGGLMVGELLGRAVGVAPLLRSAWPKIRECARHASVEDFLQVLTHNRKLVTYSLPSTLIDTVVANLPIPIIIKLYGLEAGGYFAIVQKVLSAPLGLISASVADTFHSKLARYSRESPDDMRGLFRVTSVWLLGIGLVPALMLALFGRAIMSLMFGNRWAVAGTLAALSTPWLLTQFIVSPLSRIVFVLRGQEWKLIYDAVILLTMLIVTFVAMRYRWSLLDTVWAFSLSNALAYIVYYLVLMQIVSRSASQKV